MANINKIKAQGSIYDIEDTVARTSAVVVTSKPDGTVELQTPTSTVTVPSLTNFGDPSELENDVVTEISELKSEITTIEEQISQGSGLTDGAKNALLACFMNVAWANDDGQTFYDALHDALFPPKVVTSISALFTQGDLTVYPDSNLDVLKSNLVVTATYEDGTTDEVVNYVLSGTLTEGTSTVTVSYSGKTTTFNVTVSNGNTPRYPFANNTYTFDQGYTSTVTNGNKYNLTIPVGATSPKSGTKINVSDVTKGATINAEPWFSLQEGDVVVVTLKSFSRINSNRYATFYLCRAYTTTSILSLQIKNVGDSATFTASGVDDVGCAYVGFGAQYVYSESKESKLDFSVEITVNGVRYV